MGTTKVLALTLEQTEELVNALNAEEMASTEGFESQNFIDRIKQNLRNGIDGLRQKFAGKADTVTETVTEIVEEPVQTIDSVQMEQQKASKKMSDYEYRCYLNSLVFGE